MDNPGLLGGRGLYSYARLSGGQGTFWGEKMDELHRMARYAYYELSEAKDDEEAERMSLASEQQPEPKPGQQDVADYVLRDIAERIEAGELKYGTKLQTFNGRDALWDLYQELLDAVFYARQAILERDAQSGQQEKPQAGQVSGEWWVIRG